MELGARIAHWIAYREISQAELAKAVDVSTSAVSLWVSGKASPSQANLAKIVEKLDVTMARFYGPLPKLKTAA